MTAVKRPSPNSSVPSPEPTAEAENATRRGSHSPLCTRPNPAAADGSTTHEAGTQAHGRARGFSSTFSRPSRMNRTPSNSINGEAGWDTAKRKLPTESRSYSSWFSGKRPASLK